MSLRGFSTLFRGGTWCARANTHEKYLRLPTFVGCNKYAAFTYLKQKLANKLQGWKGKTISGGGREILVKVVAHVLPVYSMSVFLVPKKICNDLNRVVARFWWSGGREYKIICWKAWKHLCKPKREGG